MRKKIVYFFLFMTLLLSIGYLYVNQVFLPVKAHEMAVRLLERHTGRDVSIGNIQYRFPRGVVINNIKILRHDSKIKPLLTVRELSFHVMILPLIQKKLIIIPSVHIHDAHLFLKKVNTQTWNISDIPHTWLGREPSDSQKKAAPFNVLCKKVILKNGTLTFMDATGPQPKIAMIENLRAQADISLRPEVRLRLYGMIRKYDSEFNIKGAFNPSLQNFSLVMNAQNVPLAPYLHSFYPSSPVSVQKGLLSAHKAALTWDNRTVSFTGDLLARHLEFSIHHTTKWQSKKLALTNADLKITPGQVTGSGRLSGDNTHFSSAGPKVSSKEWETDITSLKITPSKWDLQANLMSRETSLRLGPQKAIKGDFSIEKANIARTPEELFATGRAAIANPDVRLPFVSQYWGDITMDPLQFKHTPRQTTLQAGFHVPGLSLQLEEGQKFSGDIQTGSTRITLTENIFSVKSDLNAQNASCHLGPRESLQGHITLKTFAFQQEGATVSVTSEGQLTKADLSWREYLFQGNPLFSAALEYNRTDKKWKHSSGSLKLDGSSLKGIPRLSELTQIRGTLTLDQDTLATRSLRFGFADTPFVLSGTLLDPRDPRVNARLASKGTMALVKITPFFSDWLTQHQLDIQGQSSLTVEYAGPLKDPSSAQITLSSSITNGRISSPRMPLLNDLRNIQGDLHYAHQDQVVRWEDLSCLYHDTLYTLNGKASQWAKPRIRSSVSSAQINAFGDFSLAGDNLIIHQMKASGAGSSLAGTGTISLKDMTSPRGTLNNTFTLSLEDLSRSKLLQKNALSQIPIQGTLEGTARINGPLKAPSLCAVTLSAHSPWLAIHNYPVSDNQLEYSQKDQTSSLRWDGRAYQGDISLQAQAEAFQETVPFHAYLQIKELDLMALRKGQKFAGSHLSGRLDLKTEMRGKGTDLSSYRGTGHFLIQEGLLGEIAIVEDALESINKVPGMLGKILSQKMPGAEKTVTSTKNYITGAEGDFTIKNQAVHTDNTLLLGSLYDLKINGKVTFDQQVNALVAPDYSRFAKQTRNATEVLGSPIHLQVTGTLKNPRYKPLIDPVKPIENAVDTTIEIFKGVGSIFEDVF
jgi:hypothetical protein